MVYSPRQTNLFDLLPRESYAPKPEEMRARLHELLATARAAEHMPWTQQKSEVYEILFRQWGNWLPEQERDELHAAFVAELERLRAAG